MYFNGGTKKHFMLGVTFRHLHFFLAHLSCIWIAENFSRWTSEIHAYDGENCKIENVFATFFWCLKFVAKLNRSSFDTKDIEKYYDGK